MLPPEWVFQSEPFWLVQMYQAEWIHEWTQTFRQNILKTNMFVFPLGTYNFFYSSLKLHFSFRPVLFKKKWLFAILIHYGWWIHIYSYLSSIVNVGVPHPLEGGGPEPASNVVRLEPRLVTSINLHKQIRLGQCSLYTLMKYCTLRQLPRLVTSINLHKQWFTAGTEAGHTQQLIHEQIR